MTSDQHENLAERFPDYPDLISAECTGHGSASLRVEGYDGVIAARCPACAEMRLRVAIGAFLPPRFGHRVAVPDAVGEWANAGPKAEGLYLAGPVGTGKTHTAWVAAALWCIAANVRPHGAEYGTYDHRIPPSVIFARMTDLLDDFRPGDSSVQHVRDCQHADLLVIDDLGAEKPSEWTQERLYSVIDHRYANCLPLLVTGNLPPAVLAEQTGDRVASRLAEMCRGRVVPMTGTDRRRQP